MNAPIVVEQIFEAPRAKVWEAITKVDQMTQWFFDNIPAFEAREGFETRFVVRTERHFTHIWKIMEVIPRKKIVYDWSYEEYPGKGYVTFELIDHGEQTLLRLTNIGLESFPQDIPEFQRASCQGGWEYFIQDRLRAFLA